MTDQKTEDGIIITIRGKRYQMKGGQVFDEDGQPVSPGEQRRTLAEFIQEATADEWRGLAEFIQEATADTLAETTATLAEVRDEIQATADKSADILARIANAGPYLDEELKKTNGANLKTLFANCTLADLANDKDPRTAALLQALDAAEKRQNAIIKPEILTYPLDKISKSLFDIPTLPDGVTKSKLNIDLTPHKTNAAPASAKGVIYFDDAITKEYQLSKNTNSSELLICSVLASIWRDNHDPAGHCITTTNAIHNVLSNTAMNQRQNKKYIDCIRKAATTRFKIDNREQAEHYNYEHFIIADAALIEARIIEQATTRNGKVTNTYIEILAKPPIMTIAEKENNQLTDIPVEVLKSGISATPNNLKIQDYLIRRIAKDKNPLRDLLEDQEKHYTLARQKKITKAKTTVILTDTLLENTGRGYDRKDKSRAIETAMRYLDHYATVGWIQSAKLSKDKKKITIILPV